jgi:hypothetical protein
VIGAEGRSWPGKHRKRGEQDYRGPSRIVHILEEVKKKQFFNENFVWRFGIRKYQKLVFGLSFWNSTKKELVI